MASNSLVVSSGAGSLVFLSLTSSTPCMKPMPRTSPIASYLTELV